MADGIFEIRNGCDKMNKKLLILALLMLFIIPLLAYPTEATWWNTTWAKKVPINLSTSSS